MKKYFKYTEPTIKANDRKIPLNVSGNYFRYLRGEVPVKVTFDNASFGEMILFPGMGLPFDDQAYSMVWVERADRPADETYTQDMRCMFYYGFGKVEDNRAVADIQATYIPAVKVIGETALPIPPTISRFLPRYDPAVDLTGATIFRPTNSAAPHIAAGRAAALNLLAPYDKAVEKRILRLNTAGSAKIGFLAPGPGVAGHFVELDADDNPETEIPGGQALYGLAVADADLTILEVLRPLDARDGDGTTEGLPGAAAEPPGIVRAPARHRSHFDGITPALAGRIYFELETAATMAAYGNPAWAGYEPSPGGYGVTTCHLFDTGLGGPPYHFADDQSEVSLVYSATAAAIAAQTHLGTHAENTAYFYLEFAAYRTDETQAQVAAALSTVLFANGQRFAMPTACATAGITPGSGNWEFVMPDDTIVPDTENTGLGETPYYGTLRIGIPTADEAGWYVEQYEPTGWHRVPTTYAL